MKRLFFLLAMAAVLTTACKGPSSFTVRGDLDSAGLLSPADSVMIEYDQLQAPLTAPVVDNAFTVTGKVEGAEFSKISALGGPRRSTKAFIAEKGTITFQDGFACGTPLNDSTRAFSLRLKALVDRYDGEKLREAAEQECTSFITRHKNDPCAVYGLMIASRNMKPEAVLQLIESTSPAIRNNGDVRSISRRLNQRLPHEE